MTDTTRYSPSEFAGFQGMVKSDDGEYVRFDDYAALLTRAEAAEAERDRQYDENVHRITEQAKAEAERDEAISFYGLCHEHRVKLEAERDEAMAEAISLSKNLHATHYRDVTQWEPLNYLAGVISQIDNMIAGIIENVNAERDALAAKLALAVEALEKLHHAVCGETGFSECVRRDSGKVYPWPALDIADSLAQTALAQLTADTLPDPRIEGWNAAIEAAAKLYEGTFDALARLIRTIPCPYTPKEGKDDDQ